MRQDDTSGEKKSWGGKRRKETKGQPLRWEDNENKCKENRHEETRRANEKAIIKLIRQDVTQNRQNIKTIQDGRKEETKWDRIKMRWDVRCEEMLRDVKIRGGGWLRQEQKIWEEQMGQDKMRKDETTHQEIKKERMTLRQEESRWDGTRKE